MRGRAGEDVAPDPRTASCFRRVVSPSDLASPAPPSIETRPHDAHGLPDGRTDGLTEGQEPR
ncbi:hypothetical protein BCY76_016970 [Nesterenkonia sp. PF2B19]|nr:hypothetical protein BCY76_016970 [Nesterenkonia sp. PF2B19]